MELIIRSLRSIFEIGEQYADDCEGGREILIAVGYRKVKGGKGSHVEFEEPGRQPMILPVMVRNSVV